MQSLDFSYEQKLFRAGYSHIIGVDEVGRGPLAGPVTVGAVAFNLDRLPNLSDDLIIHDSKKLTEKRRLRAVKWIKQNSLFEIASTSVGIIDSKGIVYATQRAMLQVISELVKKLEKAKIFLYSDAFPIRSSGQLGLSGQKAVIKGDVLVFSIAAASIVAKVYRDSYMNKLASEFPVYGWSRNKGYVTREHKEAIVVYGLTPHHRRSFLKL